MRVKFTQIEDDFLRDNIIDSYTLYELTERFNREFPNHQITCSNLRHRTSLLGLKKGSHNIRKEKVYAKNSIGTVIANQDGKKARVKTEQGYVSAHKYFLDKYFGLTGKNVYDRYALVHLNGNLSDFSRENLECVTRSIYGSMNARKWFFTDPELTRTAILVATLLEFFPELRHNENQYYKMHREY